MELLIYFVVNQFIKYGLDKIKQTTIWNFGREIKLWLFSFRKNKKEISDKKKLKFIKYAKTISEGKESFYIQGRMDIDPLGYWHNPDFTKEYGGFQPATDIRQSSRMIINTCSHDLVRRDMIVLFLRMIIQNQTQGELVELGVYKGETARLIHHYCPERVLNLFDTFTGFDQRDICKENDQIKSSESVKQFKDTTEQLVLDFISPQNNNVKIFKGYFPKSINQNFKPKSLAFVHIDPDLYEPTKEGLALFYPLLSKGGIMLIHDYNAWPGARKAVDEFFLDKNEYVIPMPDKSGSAIIVKQ